MNVCRECPHCDGKGWYEAADIATGDPAQVQCEFCLATGKLYVLQTNAEQTDALAHALAENIPIGMPPGERHLIETFLAREFAARGVILREVKRG